ncbi:MAG: hypothetical protein M3209_14340 [Acidobacteriota bacterium]|nr:hypothetical protein [Acidobacteriota bacterium]
MAKKQDNQKTSTKAGMLGKTDSQAASEREKKTSKKETESTPKTSKNEAEDRNDGRPLH